MARVADVGRTQSLLRDAADGEHTATPSELARKREAGANLVSPRRPVERRGAGVSRDDVPQQNALLELQLREDALDDRRRGLGGAGAGELALRGERDPGDTRTAVAGCLADEQQPCFLPGFEVREEPLAAHGRAVTVTIEVERRADPRAPQPLDELLHPHPH